MKKTIAVIATLLVCSCFSSHIQKTIIVQDDRSRPLKDVKVYLLWDSSAPFILPMPEWYPTEQDSRTAKTFCPTTDATGKVQIKTDLYFPSDYNMVFMRSGYYPTMVPVKTKHKKIVLLSQDRYRTQTTSKRPDPYGWRPILLTNGVDSFTGITFQRMRAEAFGSFLYIDSKHHRLQDGVLLQEKMGEQRKSKQ